MEGRKKEGGKRDEWKEAEIVQGAGGRDEYGREG